MEAISSKAELKARMSVTPWRTSAMTGAHTETSPGVRAWQKSDSPSNWSPASVVRSSTSYRRSSSSIVYTKNDGGVTILADSSCTSENAHFFSSGSPRMMRPRSTAASKMNFNTGF